MSTMRSGPAVKLSAADLGRLVSITGVDGTSYEGALSYLSFDAHRGDDEFVAVAFGISDDPLEDVILYLKGEHEVTVYEHYSTDEPGDW